MPELPEVETSRRGIEPHVLGRTVRGVIVRDRRLRWPVPKELERTLTGQQVLAVRRRAKYLLFDFERGSLILHLGMSGSLRIVSADTPPQAHDHVDLCFDGQCLRLRDPRRFGALLWTTGDPLEHPRLRELGPEPLSETFDGDYLYRRARGRRLAIKSLLMTGSVVVGVGNIYANEALFLAGIRPDRASGRISRTRCERLAKAVKQVLSQAIAAGGTTLRDFIREDGQPGYFRHALQVYDRAGLPCPGCGADLQGKRIGQRATVFCAHCQH